MYDLGGVAAVPVPSFCRMSLPNGDLRLAGGNFSPAYWFESTQPHYGLLEPAVGDGPAFQRPYAGIRALGSGPVDLYVRLEPGAIVRPAVWTAEIELRENGATVAVVQYFGPGKLVFDASTFFPRMTITDPAFVVTAGNIYTTGFRIVDGEILIGVYQSGTGGGVHFTMSGTLTPEGEAPGQPPLRLHGALGSPI
jgi:hypothetical protein